MKIYTKTGDAGKTSLIGGTRVLKSDQRIKAYGTVDELNSYIGLIADYLSQDKKFDTALFKEIQDRLFTVGSSLACDQDKDIKLKIPDLYPSDISLLEKEIDSMTIELPPLKSFILPGGSIAISHIHIARCVCRSAERLCVEIRDNNRTVNPLIIQYLNRLSDYLFVLARYVAFKNNIQERLWVPRQAAGEDTNTIN
ncbi:MAG: cob(I)yrinic acid a,c-diamide adenosyltransferase [Phycisphaerales bacterium]|nr:cob(I)yrinic acid a,c-diamide adenosyltransferase [Phycisphaerales bacterium]